MLKEVKSLCPYVTDDQYYIPQLPSFYTNSLPVGAFGIFSILFMILFFSIGAIRKKVQMRRLRKEDELNEQLNPKYVSQEPKDPPKPTMPEDF